MKLFSFLGSVPSKVSGSLDFVRLGRFDDWSRRLSSLVIRIIAWARFGASSSLSSLCKSSGSEGPGGDGGRSSSGSADGSSGGPSFGSPGGSEGESGGRGIPGGGPICGLSGNARTFGRSVRLADGSQAS